jgi:3-ketosteroid 9alpha-monooxygenase subunit A
VSRIDLPPYPTGWFAVALSEDLAPSQVVPCRYFGRELAMFRDLNGTVAVLDAYCAHLGAHLGHGATVGDGCIRCPFHGWEYDLAGVCIGMPYGRRVPAAAKVRSWPVVEQDDVILVWHSPDDQDPDWFMPTFADRRWTRPRSMMRTIRSHPQEILENTVDCAHFRFVHESHMMRPEAAVDFQGRTFALPLVSDPSAVTESFRLEGSVELAGQSLCHGPGLAAANLGAPGTGLPTIQRLYATPVDGEYIELRGLVNVESADGAETAEQWADVIAPAVIENWDKDISIWENKCYRARPVLNSSERLILAFRRWYSQFYPDVEAGTGVDAPETRR